MKEIPTKTTKATMEMVTGMTKEMITDKEMVMRITQEMTVTIQVAMMAPHHRLKETVPAPGTVALMEELMEEPMVLVVPVAVLAIQVLVTVLVQVAALVVPVTGMVPPMVHLPHNQKPEELRNKKDKRQRENPLVALFFSTQV